MLISSDFGLIQQVLVALIDVGWPFGRRLMEKWRSNKIWIIVHARRITATSQSIGGIHIGRDVAPGNDVGRRLNFADPVPGENNEPFRCITNVTKGGRTVGPVVDGRENKVKFSFYTHGQPCS